MRQLLVLLICLVSVPVLAQSQSDINRQAYEAYNKADNQLNSIYQKILNDYQADKVFIKNLKLSQRIWISFRDAELKVKFPDREPGYYGSIQPMCVSNYLEQLTNERIKTLEVWINGIAESDACIGSVKMK